ncbi:adenylate/guanylate cyclase domain-containing protein [Pelagibius marinus]|uniref:adenylate/guanylate cyclase domain-containing protein n=1 Tax=Pelagibius marinus TaxID=2762760 RepID=UPI0018724923|nr:adenylate/guanylate cyclase domain-containing protein [Pelagibius marinus]
MSKDTIRYAKSDGLNIAYQVTGRGPREMVLISGWVSHLQMDWAHPDHARFLDRLGSFSRLIRFDKRGTGLSDRPGELPDLETRMDDVRAVMDATHVRRATIFGYSEGGPMAILFAATFPERVEALVIYGSYARRMAAQDYPWGYTSEERTRYADQVESEWGWENDMYLMCPSADAAMAEWWGARARASASPGSARALIEMNSLVDVREILPTIQVPTLVMHRSGDKDSRVEEGRFIADHIAGSTFVELEGEDHFVAINPDQIVDQVELFVTGERATQSTNRKLGTILFIDIVDSTGRAIAAGDEQWASILGTFEETVRKVLDRHRGRFVNTTGDGAIAVFDGPARAIRCGCDIRDASHELGLAVRCGVHTAEVEERGSDIAGIGVHVAARIAQVASEDEVWTSQTVKDLVSGSGIRFLDRGDHVLKGLSAPMALSSAVG